MPFVYTLRAKAKRGGCAVREKFLWLFIFVIYGANKTVHGDAMKKIFPKMRDRCACDSQVQQGKDPRVHRTL
jgi:hypothetical protein